MVYIKLISYRGTEFVILSWINVASQLILKLCSKMMQVLRKGRLFILVYKYVVWNVTECWNFPPTETPDLEETFLVSATR